MRRRKRCGCSGALVKVVGEEADAEACGDVAVGDEYFFIGAADSGFKETAGEVFVWMIYRVTVFEYPAEGFLNVFFEFLSHAVAIEAQPDDAGEGDGGAAC